MLGEKRVTEWSVANTVYICHDLYLYLMMAADLACERLVSFFMCPTVYCISYTI